AGAVGREAAQRGGALRLVPRDVQGDGGRRPHELEEGAGVLELLEDVARLAGTREAREARAARAQSPGGDGHPEALGALHEVLDLDPAPAQHAAEVLVVLVQPGLALAVLLGDEPVADLEMR